MKTLRELTPEMLVMTNKVSRVNVDGADIPMDFETCLNEILHPELPEWNFCKPLPFAKVHMGNIAERKEGKRKSKRKHSGSDFEEDTIATSSSAIAQVLRRSGRTTKFTPTATITACEMVKCAILEYDHCDTTQARKYSLFHLITWSLQQHTNGNPNDLSIDPKDTQDTYDGLASFAKTSDTQHDKTGGHGTDNDDNNASNDANND